MPDQAAAVAQQAEQAGAAKAGLVQLSAEDALVEHYLRAALPSKVRTVAFAEARSRPDWPVVLFSTVTSGFYNYWPKPVAVHWVIASDLLTPRWLLCFRSPCWMR